MDFTAKLTCTWTWTSPLAEHVSLSACSTYYLSSPPGPQGGHVHQHSTMLEWEMTWSHGVERQSSPMSFRWRRPVLEGRKQHFPCKLPLNQLSSFKDPSREDLFRLILTFTEISRPASSLMNFDQKANSPNHENQPGTCRSTDSWTLCLLSQNLQKFLFLTSNMEKHYFRIIAPDKI